MTTNYHLALDIRGCLWTRNFVGFSDGGKPMDKRQVFEALCDELLKGHKVYPMGECDNWDWNEGCMGHPVKEAGTEPAAATDRMGMG